MEKECWNCKFSIECDWNKPADVSPCDTCENHNKWQELKDNEK
jgi:hypothetical protein